MKMKKLLIGSIAGASLFLASCGSNPEVASTEAGPIRQEDLYERMKTTPAQTGGTYGELILQTMLIEDTLAEGYSDSVSDEEVQGQIDETAEMYGGQEQFEQVLSLSGMDISTIEDTIRTNLYLREAVKANTDITDQEIQDFYDQSIPQGTTVSHILVEDEQTANDLIDQLNNGSDFATLAQENSIDTGTAENGGQMELQAGQMVPEFEDAAMQLSEGDVTQEPVQTQFGYHIIQMDEKPEKQPLEDVRDQVVNDYVEQELITDFQVVNDVIATEIENANVQIADDELQGAIAPFVQQEGQGQGQQQPQQGQQQPSSEEGSSSEDSSSSGDSSGSSEDSSNNESSDNSSGESSGENSEEQSENNSEENTEESQSNE